MKEPSFLLLKLQQTLQLPMAFLFPTLSKIVKTMVIVAVPNWSYSRVCCKKCTKRRIAWLLGFWRCSLTLMSSGFTTQLKIVCVLHVLAFASLRRRSNLALNFNLTGKTLRKLRWKAHEELADVIEFNS